ncbi:hypothetical protein NN561_014594 [Cricetulus griseus]
MAAQRWSLLQSEQQLSWMDGLLLCHLSGVGSASIHSYSTNGKGTESHPHEDNWLKFRSKNNCFLYGVFNSYDGNQVTNFVAQRLSAELLLGQLNTEHAEANVQQVLLQAFDVVERSFLESIDDALAKKESLQSQLPEGVPQHQLLPQSVSEDPYVRPQENSGELVPSLERLKALEREISGGAMAIVAALLNKLYVANVGLDAGKFKQCCQGQIHHRRARNPWRPAAGWHYGFLVLMSEGLYKALEAAHGPGQANEEIAAMIDIEFAKQTSLDIVAEAVMDRIKYIHCDIFASGGECAKLCPQLEDMTLMVRNFGYPLGEMSQPTPTPVPGGRVYPVSVPYSSAQNTSKTSVKFSLVMPSRGQMINGSHSSSTLDKATSILTNQSPTLPLQSTNTHTQAEHQLQL